jgi:hypothetical protein
MRVKKSMIIAFIVLAIGCGFLFVKNQISAMTDLPDVKVNQASYPFEFKLPKFAPFKVTDADWEQSDDKTEGAIITTPLMVNYLSVKNNLPYQVLQVEVGKKEQYDIERMQHVRKGEKLQIKDNITAYYDFDDVSQILTWEDGDLVYNVRLFYQTPPSDGDKGFTKDDIIAVANSFEPYKQK